MLRRIEIRDRCGEWRGLFRAVPVHFIDHVLDSISMPAPWDRIDLTRGPRFYFTEQAWENFGQGGYERLRQILGPDVRLISEMEDHPNAVVIDEVQAVVYAR